MNEKLKEKFKQALEENADSALKSRKHSIPILTIIVFIMVIVGIYFSVPLFSSQSLAAPTGQITWPVPGSSTGKEVRVTGETINIESGQYIWLAVDRPSLGLCWPKKYFSSNTKFSTTIVEKGPGGLFVLSMYVLNENFHKQWKNWQDQETFGGLYLPPESKRLDSIKLVLRE